MRTALRLLALGLAMLLVGAAQAEEPLKVRAGWANTPSTMTPLLFLKKDILKHYGRSYVVEPIRFGGTSPEITALSTGELDIATLAFSSFGAAVENAGLDDLRIVADSFQDGVEGYFSTQYMVRADSPIRAIEDLKGKVIASNGIGGAIDMAIRAMLREHGLEDRRDYSLVEVAFAALNPMLIDGKAEMVGDIPPFVYARGFDEQTRVLFRMRDAMGPTQMVLYAARKEFLDTHRAALADFLEDWVRALHWYLDPANHEAAVAIVADFTKLPPEQFRDWLFTKKDYYRDPDARPNLDALQRNIETQRALGFLKSPLDVRQYTDLSLIDEAARRVKGQ
ncbi:MAG TPA: ABC transporter substrate-binding protein [Stellaceae bacterium]|nr:ABC transporter substrate-binding protein [Stellaceae bacterium]